MTETLLMQFQALYELIGLRPLISGNQLPAKTSQKLEDANLNRIVLGLTD